MPDQMMFSPAKGDIGSDTQAGRQNKNCLKNGVSTQIQYQLKVTFVVMKICQIKN